MINHVCRSLNTTVKLIGLNVIEGDKEGIRDGVEERKPKCQTRPKLAKSIEEKVSSNIIIASELAT